MDLQGFVLRTWWEGVENIDLLHIYVVCEGRFLLRYCVPLDYTSHRRLFSVVFYDTRKLKLYWRNFFALNKIFSLS